MAAGAGFERGNGFPNAASLNPDQVHIDGAGGGGGTADIAVGVGGGGVAAAAAGDGDAGAEVGFEKE